MKHLDNASASDESPPASGAAGEASHGYRRRASLGAIALAARTGLMQFVILGATIVLARRLRPAEFGVFAMVQFVVTLLTLFGDGGLGVALIQRSQKPSAEDLSSVFWAQMAFALPVLGISVAVGPYLPLLWTDLPQGSMWLLLAVASNFLFTCARVVPTLLMERELHFTRLAVLETVSETTYYLVAAILALKGFGTASLAIGVFCQGLSAFLLAFALRPWRPKWHCDWALVRELLRFGLPVQARPGLLLLTRAVIAVLGGAFFGSRAVGMVTWALETAFFPLTFVYILSRVSFPLYSRLKGEPAELGLELARYVRAGLAITFFLVGMFLGLAPQLTEVIYSAQWLDAVPSLRWFAGAIGFGVLMQLLAPAFDALGNPRPVMAQLVLVMALVWGGSFVFAQYWGEVAFGMAWFFAMGVGALVIRYMARASLPPVPFFAAYWPAVLAGGAVAALGHFVVGRYIEGPLTLALAVVVELAVYLLTLRWVGPTSF